MQILLEVLKKTSNKYNYLLNLYTTHGEEEKEQRVIKLINSNMVDGLIIMAYYIKDNFIDFKNEGFLLYLLIIQLKMRKYIQLLWIMNLGAFEATEYLISLGHQNCFFWKVTKLRGIQELDSWVF